MGKEGWFFAISRFPEHKKFGRLVLTFIAFQEHMAWVKFNIVQLISMNLCLRVEHWGTVGSKAGKS